MKGAFFQKTMMDCQLYWWMKIFTKSSTVLFATIDKFAQLLGEKKLQVYLITMEIESRS